MLDDGVPLLNVMQCDACDSKLTNYCENLDSASWLDKGLTHKYCQPPWFCV